MEYFAVQVWTGKEDEFAARIGAAPGFGALTLVPKRALNLRRRGRQVREERPLFPGYAFIVNDEPELTLDQRWALRTTPFFLRALPDTSCPRPINERDRRILAHFMSFGKTADTSVVYFDENERIVVVDGPLKGFEGLIVRVDKRKGRAKIRLDMCEDSFLVDLAFVLLNRSSKGNGSGHDGTP